MKSFHEVSTKKRKLKDLSCLPNAPPPPKNTYVYVTPLSGTRSGGGVVEC